MVLCVLTGWLDRREREAVAYLIEENRLLRRQLGTRRLRLTDDDRRRLAARAYRVGRSGLTGDRHDRDAGHVAALASSADRAQMDVRQPGRAARHHAGDSTACRPHGGGESDVGLHADPRRAEERGAPRGAIDDSAHPEGGRSSTRTAAADLMADVSQGALGRHRRRRLSSRPKSGRGAAWRRITPCSSWIWPRAASTSSDPRPIPVTCSWAKSSS